MPGPYLGEIRLFSSGTAPTGWAACNGQLLPINQHPALFALLGTSYGGDGQTSFRLPDLRGRTTMHTGNGHVVAESGGAASHTLLAAEMPLHTHALNATNGNAATPSPVTRVLGAANNLYTSPASLTPLNPGSVAQAGGGQPHPNMQPFLAMTFCIALQGGSPS
jgi:microcystin-dependent protein